MKKIARKKSPKEAEIISKVVSEIIEEEKPEIPDGEGKEKLVEITEEREEKEGKAEGVDVISEDSGKPSEPAGEETRSASFYEKVMGEKPPEVVESDETKKERSINTKLFFLGAFVFVLTVLLSSMVGLAILNKDLFVSKIAQKGVQITPTLVPATPTPPDIKKEEWTFEVLNGSSTAGLAAKGAEKIKALGYRVGKVGNADDSVDVTQVFISKDVTEVQKKLILEDLKKDFGTLTETDTIPDSKKTVRIILAN